MLFSNKDITELICSFLQMVLPKNVMFVFKTQIIELAHVFYLCQSISFYMHFGESRLSLLPCMNPSCYFQHKQVFLF